ncbi:MAG: hypothetical protein ABJP45_16145 [Cyclobacteriaceae bacterium]
MPNEQLYREIQNLERKIQLVLSDNQKLREDLSQTQSENQILKTKVESQMTNISSFQNQMKANKLVNNMVVDGSDSGELKVKLDGYIKEIDKCIAHLAE